MFNKKIISGPFKEIKNIDYFYLQENLEKLRPLIFRIPNSGETDIEYLLSIEKESSLWQYSVGIFTQKGELAAIILAREQENCFGFPGTSIFIEYISVKEAYEKRRYAVKLLHKLFNLAINNEINKIFLTVDPKNEKAINRYRKMGFNTITNFKSTPEEVFKKGADVGRVMFKKLVIQREEIEKLIPL